MGKWATFDRDKLIDMRNERSAELRALGGGGKTVRGFHQIIKAVKLEATIDAIDCVLEASGRVTLKDEAHP